MNSDMVAEQIRVNNRLLAMLILTLQGFKDGSPFEEEIDHAIKLSESALKLVSLLSKDIP